MATEKEKMPKYKICDKYGKILVNDNIVEAREEIHKHKLKFPFISYDGEYFFNSELKKFSITKSDVNDEKVLFNINKFDGCNIVKLDQLDFLVKFSNEDFEKEINKYDIIIDNKENKVIKKQFKYKIIDKNGKVLVNDYKKNSKVSIFLHELKKPFISFDNMNFFNSDSTKFRITKDYNNDDIVSFDVKNFSNYSIIQLRDLSYVINISDEEFEEEINKYDIIYDYGLDGLDPEVKGLVEALNSSGLNIETYGSCSGHRLNPLWVTIGFNDYISIKRIVLLIDIEFHDSFVLSYDDRIKHENGWNNDNFILQLATKDIGEKAYKLADDFANALLRHKDEWRSKI